LESKKRRWFPWQPKKGGDQETQDIIKKIAEKPDDPRLHQRLAELHLEKGRKDKAVEEFIKAAECHSEAGFYLRAIALYRRILRMEEESSEILLRLAELYLANGLLGDALVQFRKVIHQYRQQGKTQEIFGLLRRMVESDPENLEVRAKYIELLRSEGFLVEAFDELIRLNVGGQERAKGDTLQGIEHQIQSVYEELKDQLSRQGNAKEVANLDQKMQALSIQREPGPPQSKLEEIEEPESKLEEIEIDLGMAVLEDPPPAKFESSSQENTLEQLREAQIYAEQGLWDEAEALFLAILEVDPVHSDALVGLQNARGQRQQITEAKDQSGVFQKLNRLEDKSKQVMDSKETAVGPQGSASNSAEDAHTHYELGLAYRELGMLDESIEELCVASKAPSLAFSSYREIAACHSQKGDLQQTIAHLRKAMQCVGVPQEDLLEVSYRLAQILEQSGMREQALLLYRKIGEKDQEYRDIQERVKSLSQ
jgi:tetratricopeptide (TPR) repeat protein